MPRQRRSNRFPSFREPCRTAENDETIVRLASGLIRGTYDARTFGRRHMGLESLARIADTLNHRLFVAAA